MRADWEYSADCILALARGGHGEDEAMAADAAALVAQFLHLVVGTLK